MTGTDVVNKAMLRLNYTDENGEVNLQDQTDVLHRALDAVNYILNDLRHVARLEYIHLDELRQEIPMPEEVCERVMPWGVAMILAGEQGDANGQAVAASMYNQLRNSVHRVPERRADVLPRPFI